MKSTILQIIPPKVKTYALYYSKPELEDYKSTGYTVAPIIAWALVNEEHPDQEPLQNLKGMIAAGGNNGSFAEAYPGFQRYVHTDVVGRGEWGSPIYVPLLPELKPRRLATQLD